MQGQLGGGAGSRDVRGKQGRKVDEFSGARRSRSSARRLFDEAREAAIALAPLREAL